LSLSPKGWAKYFRDYWPEGDFNLDTFISGLNRIYFLSSRDPKPVILT
jgi:hypothetical protein